MYATVNLYTCSNDRYVCNCEPIYVHIIDMYATVNVYMCLYEQATCKYTSNTFKSVYTNLNLTFSNSLQTAHRICLLTGTVNASVISKFSFEILPLVRLLDSKNNINMFSGFVENNK